MRETYGVAQAILAGGLAPAAADDLALGICCQDPAAGRRLRGPWREMRTETAAGRQPEPRRQAQGPDSAADAPAVVEEGA
ncbi:hypothetical protein ACFVYP_19815 [Kitasatospora sp. NPDC058201]|uniref:hypothetical protein n=1 Tax=unclassified Kitasatospora TaxID=2633591 RepID=UPI00364DE2D3